MNTSFQFKKGFTLIEMVVSLAIFSVVAVVALGSLMRIMTANQKAQSLQSAMSNVSFALESMSRELRMGTEYVNSPLGTIIFTSLRRKPVEGTFECYLKSAYRVYQPVPSESIYLLQKAEASDCSTDNFTNNEYVDMISPSVTLTTGTSLSVVNINDPYTLVSIKLVGYVGAKEKTRTYFDVQTKVSQRVGDTNTP